MGLKRSNARVAQPSGKGTVTRLLYIRFMAESVQQSRSAALPEWLRPAYIDEVRRLVQDPMFTRLADKAKLGGACLNAGCGEMGYFEWLDQRFDSILHMDLETPRQEIVRGNSKHRSTPGSVTEIPCPDAAFDFVFCTEVLEHVPDDALAAREMARVLKSGGYLLISTPTPPAPFDPNHVREGYTLAQMTDVLGKAGFSVLHHEFAFHAMFRNLYRTSEYLRRMRGGYSAVPRFIMRSCARFDAAVPLGKPFDIAVLARKN